MPWRGNFATPDSRSGRACRRSPLVRPGGPRQRTVLALLSLNANRVTSIEQLIEAVWHDSPPCTARSQIQICISGLRKLFTEAGYPQAIKTRSPGYLLELGTDELDSLEFTSLVTAAKGQADAGRIAEAATTLRRALALWRGPALAGVQSELVQRGATVLNDQRLAAVEERVRLDLLLGRHEELSVELRALISEHPLRERLYGFLMLALYRSGRQAEALEVFRSARRTLVEEVGIEPGQELRDLERAILNRDPSLDLPSVGTAPATAGTGIPGAVPAAHPGELQERRRPIVPRQLPASIADFTGRESHLAEIRQLLTGERGLPLCGYALPIIAISGKGGVGKSSLAIRAAHELSDHFPDGHLYADMQAPNGDNRTATVLARFLRALGVPGTAVPEDLEERAELYRSELAGKRVLVVLDDAVCEEQVLPLLPGSPTCAVIVTSRARMSGLPGAYWVDVNVFDTDQSLELLGRIIGPDRVQAERNAAMELVAFCEGLPLALRIAGARLASRPHWRIGELVRRLRDERRRLDEFTHHGLELRSNIGLTYQSLTPEAQRLFRLFALIQAPDFPAWTAAALLDTDLSHAEDVLESLVDAQVLDAVAYPDARCLRYRFHNLIRFYAQERLLETETPVERAAALKRVLGAWLALTDEAHRREYGGDYTILHGGAPRWRPPGEELADSIGTPLDWWESERRALVAAVRQAADAGLDEVCWDLALTSVTLFEARGYFDDWRQTTQVALDAARRADNRNGIAAMLYSMGTLHMFQTRLTEAEQCFTTALELFEAEGNAHGSALVLRNAAHVDGLRGNSAAMMDKYDRALKTMRLVGDRIGEAHILRSQARFWMDEGDTCRAQTLLEQALTICQQEGCLRAESQVVHRFAELYVATGRVELARQAPHQVLRIVRSTGDRIGEAYALYGLGVVRHREGRLASAETTLVHALDLSRRVGEQLIEAKALYSLGEITLARGNNATAAVHLEAARALFEQLGSAVWHARALVLLSEAHAGDGNTERARQEMLKAIRLLGTVNSKESAPADRAENDALRAADRQEHRQQRGATHRLTRSPPPVGALRNPSGCRSGSAGHPSACRRGPQSRRPYPAPLQPAPSDRKGARGTTQRAYAS